MAIDAMNSNSRSDSSSNSSDPVVAQAAASLQLLLHEDPALVEHGLTVAAQPDTVAWSYAAALLSPSPLDGKISHDGSSSFSSLSTSASASSRAAEALLEVERKLALTESLAVKLSRTSPAAVAGHLLRLHGFTVPSESKSSITTSNNNLTGTDESSVTAITTTTTATATATATTTLTLDAIRDRAGRLERSAEQLEGTCARVEASVTKALVKLQTSTATLERVLAVSSALKMILRLQFETTKLLSYDLDDVRDLTRAAAAVAVLEQLLAQQSSITHQQQAPIQQSEPQIHTSIAVVDQLRPIAEQTALAVRRAAQERWQEQHQSASTSGNLPALGAVLQVYFHLGELPNAVWQLVDQAHTLAITATRQLFQPLTLQQIQDQVAKLAQAQKNYPSLSTGSSTAASSSAVSAATRDVAKLRKQVRATVTVQWAQGVLEAATLVRNVHRVLLRKSDPVTRTSYAAIVAASPRPEVYHWSKSSTSTSTRNKSSGTTNSSSVTEASLSLFDWFWGRFCDSLAATISSLLEQQKDTAQADVAALYPAVRAAALEMVGHLQESTRFSNSNHAAAFLDDTATATTGILGGTVTLNDPFLDGDFASSDQDNPQSAASMAVLSLSGPSADTWTTAGTGTTNSADWVPPTVSQLLAATTSSDAANSASSSSAMPHHLNGLSAVVTHCLEWKMLQGIGGSSAQAGLFPLQQAFLQACQDRLTSPLQYMFPESVAMDDEGITISGGLSLLPSKYDIQRFDENIRLELSLADPREGGGDLTAVTMIAECVVSMISEFCVRAKKAMSGVGESGYVNDSDWSMTDSLQHDRKVVAIMYTLKQYLQSAPEKTFVTPYRPAVLPQHQDAANLCSGGLAPALTAIDNTVKFVVLLPLCRALNRRIRTALAKMHSGAYLDTATASHSAHSDGIDDGNDSPSFVQKEIVHIFDLIAEKHLSRFPPTYSAVIASNITSFTMFTFLSNASLIRPLSESARLHLTQDLADLEMVLEQLVSKTGSTLTLHQVENGKPYAELRAVRQMLFWTGLDNRGKPADEVAKSLLRELWTKDMRVSTLFHYLFSFGPSMLSSPHHTKRISAAEYVQILVQLDGSIVTGEDAAWITIMSCCDSYVQRASASTATDSGDSRIAQIVMTLGQELLRRRGRN